MPTLGERVTRLRAQQGITQEYLATQIGGSTSNVSRLEKGEIIPAATTIVQICNYFDVSADWLLTGKDRSKGISQVYTLLETPKNSHLLNGLDEIEKRLVLERIQTLIDIRKAKEAATTPPLVAVPPTIVAGEPPDDYEADEDDDTTEETEEVFVYDEPAAAGSGSPLTEEGRGQWMRFPKDDLPKGADYGVRISGDSMEPHICDGDIVFIREQPHVDEWETGIFEYHEDSFCKRVHTEPKTGHVYWISLNPKYKRVRIDESEDVVTRGLVVGVYRP